MKTLGQVLSGPCVRVLWLSWLLHFIPAKAQENKINLLVAINTSDPLAVDYRTTGNTVRSALLAGGLLDIGISSLRESGHSKKLRETVGDFDRYPIVKAGVEGAFGTQAQYFNLSFVSNPGGKVDIKNARKEGHSFILELEETFSGMISAWRLSSLSASSTVSYVLRDVETGKTITKGSLSGFARPIHEFEEGVSNKDAFMKEYPLAVGTAVGTIIGQLGKDGHFATMATASGVKDYVPPLTAFLKEYEKKFDYTIKSPRGWSVVDMGTKYTTVLAPKGSDRAYFGLRLDIDLLIKELGQELDDLDAYVALARNRILNIAYTEDKETQTGIPLKDEYRQVVFNRPGNAGKEILVFIPFGKEYVGLYSVVVLKDYETYMKKYKEEIEGTLASITLTSK